MASSPSLWYGNYKGAVYPTDLHVAPTDLGARVCHVKTLVELCAEKIVQDSDLTRYAISSIPKPLYKPLMKEALFKNREQAVCCIVGAWSSSELHLSHLVPPLFTSVQPLYNMTYLDDIVSQGLQYTSCLVRSFLEALKNNCDTKLKLMDLSGFPTEEVIVYFLATHCMLAHNEVCHETNRNMHEQAVPQAGSDDVGNALEPMEHSLPQDCSMTIKLDIFVTSKSTCLELCKALKVSGSHNCKMSIMIGRLAMTCLGQDRISLLLNQLHPQHLTGLQLQYNNLKAQDLVTVAPALKTLVCLESLDLSCNSIFFHQNEAACSAAAQVFECMPRLHRLDLSNNCIETQLECLLKNITLPLTYLRLAGCGLTVTDMTYLSRSIHCKHLIELDLSENNLRQCDHQFKEIITASKSSLCVLEVENCTLDQNNINSFCPRLFELSSLLYVNFSKNRLPQDCQVLLLATMVELVALQVYKSSYALECYEGEGEEDLKAAALVELNCVVNRSSVQSRRPKPLMLFWTELE